LSTQFSIFLFLIDYGIIDCNSIEVSTPEAGTTYRIEDDYKRPNETEELRQKERANT